MKPVSPRASRGAFTLLEILVVIAIIAILASLLLNTAGFIQEKAGISRAQTEIQAIQTALEAYKQDYGDYPVSSAGGKADGSTNSSIVLLEELNRTRAQNKEKIYLTELGKMIPPNGNPKATYEEKVRDARALVDPFGNGYHYEYDPEDDNIDRSGKGFFNLWSQGKGGSKNDGATNKWIKSW